MILLCWQKKIWRRQGNNSNVYMVYMAQYIIVLWTVSLMNVCGYSYQILLLYIMGIQLLYHFFRSMSLHDSAQIFSVKLASWMRAVIPIKEWYHHNHANLTTLDGLRSKWFMWNQAMEVVRESIQQIQNYLYNIEAGK